MDKNNYRERTDEEIEELRQNFKEKDVALLCRDSYSSEACTPSCSRFKNCFRFDYSSKLQDKIKK